MTDFDADGRQPEFSRPVPFDGRAAAEPVEIAADMAECAALAARLGVEAVEGLRGRLELHPSPGGRIRITGRFEAVIQVICGVSLDPLAVTVDEAVDEWFVRARTAAPLDLSLDPLADLAEPVVGDSIDLGELTSQLLSLAIDPYARAADAALEAATAAGVAPAPAGPFAALAELKDRLGESR